MTDAANRPYSRTLLFAGRTAREILRDPLSFVFCLALPVVMLVAMHLLFADGAPVVFSLEVLTPGIAVFSNAFIMLFMTLLVSRDRSTAFLCRLYTSPMRTVDFVGGICPAGPGHRRGTAGCLLSCRYPCGAYYRRDHVDQPLGYTPCDGIGPAYAGRIRRRGYPLRLPLLG